MDLLPIERAILPTESKLPTEFRGPIFIVHAPRTGSTFLFQSLIAAFRLPYVANMTNDNFGDTPIVGLSIQQSWPAYNQIMEKSRFGKTEGLMQPSEASALMRHWFGGGHPSELACGEFLENKKQHMQATFGAAFALFGDPMVIKNAWNSFRIRALSEAFPSSAFIWARRDLEPSALSDLAARYSVQGDPMVWNSATPRNVDELRLRPYPEQVVENQVEFARAISAQFQALPPSRRSVVWYEDFVRNPGAELQRLARELSALERAQIKRLLPVLPAEDARGLPDADRASVVDFISREADRLKPHRYDGIGA